MQCLRDVSSTRPLRLITFLLGLGLSFGLTSVVASIGVASWGYLPPGVAAQNYFTIGHRSVSGQFGTLSSLDVAEVESMLSEFLVFSVQPLTIEVSEPDGSISTFVGRSVSEKFFQNFRVDTHIGRHTLTNNGQPAVIISYKLWKSYFGSDLEITKTQLEPVNFEPLPIIAVAQERFIGIAGKPADLWIINAPIELQEIPPIPNLTEAEKIQLSQIVPNNYVFGISNNEINISVIQQLLSGYQFTDKVVNVGGVTIRIPYATTDKLEAIAGLEVYPDARYESRTKITWLFSIVAVLLVLSAITLTNFLLTNAYSRENELAIRIAVGATPANIFKQSIIENSIWLVTIAFLAWLSSNSISYVLLQIEPFSSYLGSLSNQFKIVGLTIGIFLLTISSLVSFAYLSWTVSNSSLSFASTLTQRTKTRGHLRILRRILLSIVMVALLFSFSVVGKYVNQSQATFAFQHTNATLINMSSTKYITSIDEIRARRQAISDAIKSNPFVESVATAGILPLSDIPTTLANVSVSSDQRGTPKSAYINSVTPSFFNTLGIDFLAGRQLHGQSESDIVISASAASEFAENPADALGTYLTYRRGTNEVVRQVVGVVGDIPYSHFSSDVQPVIYENMLASTSAQSYVHWVVLHSGSSDKVVDPLRESNVLRNLKIESVDTPSNLFRRQFVQAQSVAMVFAIASLFSMLLALVAVSQAVVRRVTEDRAAVGIRMAVGATSSDVAKHYYVDSLGDVVFACTVTVVVTLITQVLPMPETFLIPVWMLLPTIACVLAIFVAIIYTVVRQYSVHGSIIDHIQCAD